MLNIATAKQSFDVCQGPVLSASGVDYTLAYHPIPPVLVERDWSRGSELPGRLR